MAYPPDVRATTPESYSSDPLWSDVVPIPQDDGGPDSLAAIAYTDEYSEAMSYLRAVMAANEFSDRVLDLTEHIISMNPSHYTVWLYRAKTIFSLGKEVREEIDWLNDVALQYLKNYQIWHHRQVMVDRLDDPTGELDFISKMFAKDAKNYHVWSYRQWLVPRFDLWDTELPDVEKLLEEDVRNNSAWNYRFFIVFSRGVPVDPANVEREIKYAEDAILKAPQNESPWNYLRGVLNITKRPLTDVKGFCEQFADVRKPDDVRSSYALDFLADINAEGEGDKGDAAKALDLLATKYDPIRANYWMYRKKLLEQPSAAA